MSIRVDYKPIIKHLEDSNEDKIEITQKLAKKLVNNELPKSLFDDSYIKKGKNELARYILENEYEFTVVEPKIIVKKKTA